MVNLQNSWNNVLGAELGTAILDSILRGAVIKYQPVYQVLWGLTSVFF